MYEIIVHTAFPLALVLGTLLVGVLIWELISGEDTFDRPVCSICNLRTPIQKMVGDTCCWCDRDQNYRKVDERV